MKRNVILKLFIDITMLVLYVLLMFAQHLGDFFHEVVGIGIGVLFLIHVLLNYSMIKGLFKSVKNKNLRKIILLASDIVLTICMPIVIVTGILIAKELFAIRSGISWMLLFNMHNILAYVCLGVMVLHILLHKKYLLGVLKKLASPMSKKEMVPAISRFFAGVIVAVILYSSLAIYKNTFDSQNLPKDLDSSNIDKSDSAAPTNNSNNYHTESSENNEDKESKDEDNKTSATENTDGQNSITTDNTASPPPTLEEYLSKLRCTGCGRGCFLLNPRCGKGKMQASQAEKEYNQIYTDKKSNYIFMEVINYGII